MRPYLLFSLLVFIMASCTKQPAQPVATPPPADIVYHQLKDTTLRWGADPIVYDFDNNQRFDLIFYTELVGDFINKIDKRKYYVFSSITTRLAVSPEETVPVLSKNAAIAPVMAGHEWYEFSEVPLMERHEHVSGATQWFGNWQNQERKFLPFQLVKAQQVHYGWVEISTNTATGTVTLHRAAWCTTPNKQILAGQ